MRRLRLLLLAVFLWASAAGADVLVIVHPQSPVIEMTRREVSDLYLGRSRTLGPARDYAAEPAIVYEQPTDSPLRERFFRSLNGMRIPALNAYWARLRFSGEVLPPRALNDSHAVIEAVSRQREAIGYVDADAPIPVHSVRIVLRLKE